MSAKKFPHGSHPTGDGQNRLPFSLTTVSGVLDEAGLYRISADADCVYVVGEMHSTLASLSNGAFLQAGEVEYIHTSKNGNVISAAAAQLTTSGVMTVSKMNSGTA